MDAIEVIERLGLEPHPEGGHYVECWRDDPSDGSRGVVSSILFLLAAGERSHWHRVDAEEIWFFHAGDPLLLHRSPDASTEPETRRLGVDLESGDAPQVRIPTGWWQAAESTGAWTLVSCTVSPAFSFDGFDLAAPGFRPGGEVD